MFSENFRLMSKIVNTLDSVLSLTIDKPQNIDAKIQGFINEKDISYNLLINTNNNQVDFTLFKIRVYKLLSDSFSLSVMKDIPLKTTMNELMNFQESLILQYKVYHIYNIQDINEEIYLKEYYGVFIPILTYYLDSNDDFQKIFGIEILLKFFMIKFEDNYSNKELDLVLNLPIVIWDRLLNLCEHTNYKIAVFAVYIIQLLSPKETISNIINLKLEKINDLMKELEKNTDDILSIISPSISYWLSEIEKETLHNFIRDKIIFDMKVKNTIEKNENNFPTLPSSSNEDKDNIDKGLKIDEINDYIDYNKIPEIIEEEKEMKESIMDKIKEENMSLEDLGVIEVDDEIFENFDEDNIPVIKNIYKRKKGSAEKLKTNQNARNLLMSNHNNHVTVNVNKPDIPINKQDRLHNYKDKKIIEENKNTSLDKLDEDLLPDLQTKKSTIIIIFRKYKTTEWFETCYSSYEGKGYK